MNDIRYLLSIKELLDAPLADSLTKQACGKLDAERLRKLKRIVQGKKRAECIGAGLLLQLGLQRIARGETDTDGNPDAVEACGELCEEPVQSFTVSQVMEMLGDPIEPEYRYGEKGKPYFQNIPVYFNLSHSEEYVFCVFSEQETGVDIQYRKPLSEERLIRRFFSERELKLWEQCASREEKERLFYRLWTRKEAYGKLTGEGIASAVSLEVPGVLCEEFEILDHYQIAVCKRAGEKE